MELLKAKAFLLGLFLLPQLVFAQDLVPNGSFEGKKSKSSSRPWTFVNTIDYFVYSPTAPHTTNEVDKNQTLRQPHSGNAYIGMRIWGGYREYLQVKLASPLKAGKKYSFKMYLSVSPYCNSIAKEIGASFSKSAIAVSDYTVVEKTKPQVSFALTRAYKDSAGWFLVSGTFTARGGEKFLSIGHFTDRFRTHFSKKQPMRFTLRKEAYYYIDDVSLYELNDAGEEIRGKQTTASGKPDADTAREEKSYIEQQAQTQVSIVLKNIYFASAKAELLPESYDGLGVLLDFLNENPAVEIEIIGHTDSTGNEEANKKLSLQRAQAVVKYLVDNGIDGKRLTFSGKGSEEPLAANQTEEGRQQNRRVEFVIRKK